MLSSSPASLACWLVALTVTALASAPAPAAQQEPVWANDLVPKQSARPAEDEPHAAAGNGNRDWCAHDSIERNRLYLPS